MKNTKKPRLTLAIAALSGLSLAPALRAATPDAIYNWTQTGSGIFDFLDAANWSADPSSVTTNVFINIGNRTTANTVSHGSGTTSFTGNLLLGLTSGPNVQTLAISGGELSVASVGAGFTPTTSFTGYNLNASSSTGGNATVHSSGVALRVQTGGTFSTNGYVANGSAQTFVEGGIMNVKTAAGSEQVRMSDNSSMTVSAGTLNIGQASGGINPQFIVGGSNATDNASLTVSGGVVNLNPDASSVKGNLSIGARGAGTVTVSGGTLNARSAIALSGELNFNNSANANNSTPTTGTITLSSGAINNHGVVNLGNNNYARNSVATVTISGGAWTHASTATGTRDFNIGVYSPATVALSGGSLTVSAADLVIGKALAVAVTDNTGGTNAAGNSDHASADFTLSGNGVLSVGGTIRGFNTSAVALRNFNFNGGTLIANQINMTNIGRATGGVSGAATEMVGSLVNNGGVLSLGGSQAGRTVLTGNYNVVSEDARLAVNLFGTAAATQFQDGMSGKYSQLVVNGTVALDGHLDIALGDFTPTIGDLFFVIANDGSDSISGTFVGLSQGSVFSAAGYHWTIGYSGDSATNSFTGGNDLVLLATAIPEPAHAAAAFGALALAVGAARRRRRA